MINYESVATNTNVISVASPGRRSGFKTSSKNTGGLGYKLKASCVNYLNYGAKALYQMEPAGPSDPWEKLPVTADLPPKGQECGLSNERPPFWRITAERCVKPLPEPEVDVEIVLRDERPEIRNPDDYQAEYQTPKQSKYKRSHSANPANKDRIFKLTEEIQREEKIEKDSEWQGKLECWASSLEEAIRVIQREQALKRRMAAIQRDRIALRNQMNSVLSDREIWKQKCAAMEKKLNNVPPNCFDLHKSVMNPPSLLSNPISRSSSVPRLTDNDFLHRLQKPLMLNNSNNLKNGFETPNNFTSTQFQSQRGIDWRTALLVDEIRQLEQHVAELNQKVFENNNLKKSAYL